MHGNPIKMNSALACLLLADHVMCSVHVATSSGLCLHSTALCHMELVYISGQIRCTTQYLAGWAEVVATPTYKSYDLKNLLHRVNSAARLL